MNVNLKSLFQHTYLSYKLMQSQLPSILSLRYKSVGIQKQVRTRQRYKFDKPNALLIKELEEETDFMLKPTAEHIKDQVEFRNLEIKSLEWKNDMKSIENRYFRDYKEEVRREPNLLTWAMKEHLINLHTLDPEAWNVETLSYAFPASRYRVSQILKTKLNPPSKEKLKKHDERVLQNWKTLTKGKFGSIALLKKIISGRIENIGGGNLPVAESDIANKMKGLIFTPTGDMHGENEILSTPVDTRKHYWFRDIITIYEERKLLAGKDNDTNTTSISTTKNKLAEKIELQKCKDLNEIKSIRNQNYDLSPNTPNVQIRHGGEEKFGRKPFGRKILTYEEFLKRKNKKQN